MNLLHERHLKPCYRCKTLGTVTNTASNFVAVRDRKSSDLYQRGSIPVHTYILRPSDVHMRQWTWWSFVQIMAVRFEIITETYVNKSSIILNSKIKRGHFLSRNVYTNAVYQLSLIFPSKITVKIFLHCTRKMSHHGM